MISGGGHLRGPYVAFLIILKERSVDVVKVKVIAEII